MIKLERAYDSINHDDGVRFLVERLWPRGVKKAALDLDDWLKDAAPSTELRQWFSHDPAKWTEFNDATGVNWTQDLKLWSRSSKPPAVAESHWCIALTMRSTTTQWF
jgi:uncharacterized protein YeaO (DUF488 family)